MRFAFMNKRQFRPASLGNGGETRLVSMNPAAAKCYPAFANPQGVSIGRGSGAAIRLSVSSEVKHPKGASQNENGTGKMHERQAPAHDGDIEQHGEHGNKQKKYLDQVYGQPGKALVIKNIDERLRRGAEGQNGEKFPIPADFGQFSPQSGGAGDGGENQQREKIVVVGDDGVRCAVAALNMLDEEGVQGDEKGAHDEENVERLEVKIVRVDAQDQADADKDGGGEKPIQLSEVEPVNHDGHGICHDDVRLEQYGSGIGVGIAEADEGSGVEKKAQGADAEQFCPGAVETAKAAHGSRAHEHGGKDEERTEADGGPGDEGRYDFGGAVHEQEMSGPYGGEQDGKKVVFVHEMFSKAVSAASRHDKGKTGHGSKDYLFR
jgi:hypothetical protein